MSDGSLSQDEIDALLQGTDTIDVDSGPANVVGSALSEKDRLAFQTLLRDVVDSQSSNLSMLTGKTVSIDAPTVQAVSPDELAADLPDELIEVKIDFSDGVTGEHSYLLTVETATRIAALMMGQEGIDLDDVAYSTLGEAVSNITGPTTTAIGNRISGTIQTSAPVTRRVTREELSLPEGEAVVRVEYPLTMEGDMPSRLIEVYALPIVSEVAGQAPAASPPPAAAASRPSAPPRRAAAPSGGGQQPAFNPSFAGPGFGGMGSPPPNVQPVQFASLQAGPAAGEQGNIGLLMDVYMEMTVELGRTRKLVKDILTIGEGSIIELDKLAGEPVDILVNHKLIAKGEVVVIDENFGVRVTEIVSPMERMGDITS